MPKRFAWPIFVVLLAFVPVSVIPAVAASVEDRLHARLQRLAQVPALAAEPVTLIIEADRLSRADVAAYQGELHHSRGRLHQVTLPARRITSLIKQLPDNAVARLPYPNQAVAVTGQGVAISGAADMHGLGTLGAGVTIGIIDLGFASLANAQATGDLPVSLTAVDYTGTGLDGTNHGTNVAQIVHEMAPGASLYLAKVSTEVELSQALDDMAAAGVRIINHSVVWFAAAFYDGTGPICDIADSAAGKGVLWVNAMGNHRLKHYLGTFMDSNADLRHEFTAGQNYNTINLTANSPVTLILNWDAYPTTTVDYDIYLYNGNPDSGGTIVASSASRQSGKGPSAFPYPYEMLDYTPTTTGTHYIVVKKVNSSQPNLPLTLFSTGPDLVTRTTASSLLQPADCASVLSVGAVNLADAPEGFSSEGPTTDGRQKPEVSAPNRVQTSLTTSFAGTSAASPHVAGAAGLLLSRSPLLSPAELRTSLITEVKDLSPVGFDYRTGFGRISLDADSDGLNHDEELVWGTSPISPDTDGDGLTDWAEVIIWHTNPTVADRGDLAPRGAPDGVVNVADLLLLARFVAGLDVPDGVELVRADMNGDATLDVRDTLLLRRQMGY